MLGEAGVDIAYCAASGSGARAVQRAQMIRHQSRQPATFLSTLEAGDPKTVTRGRAIGDATPVQPANAPHMPRLDLSALASVVPPRILPGNTEFDILY